MHCLHTNHRAKLNCAAYNTRTAEAPLLTSQPQAAAATSRPQPPARPPQSQLPPSPLHSRPKNKHPPEAVYLRGMKREEWVAPIPGLPCLTGL